LTPVSVPGEHAEPPGEPPAGTEKEQGEGVATGSVLLHGATPPCQESTALHAWDHGDFVVLKNTGSQAHRMTVEGHTPLAGVHAGSVQN